MLEILNSITVPFLNISLLQIFILSIILIVSIWFHEFAHARTSVKLWDPTPRIQWRLTLNPFAHLDPVWFIMIFLIHFWRWKPVEVNPIYYKNPIRDELIVSLAWPFSNILLATVGIIFIILNKIYFNNNFLYLFFYLFSIINIALAIFNMLPLPPLDWYRLVKFFKPEWWYWIDQNIWILSIFFLIIILTPWIGDIIKNFIITTSTLIFNILYHILSLFFILILNQ